MPLSTIGFGAFKIGRNVGIKYPQDYVLPDEHHVEWLLNGVLDLGINLIDTAPAYGQSEQLIGKFIAHRRDQYFLSTKVGETFAVGQSTYDYSRQAIHLSIDRSRKHLASDVIDLAFIHSNGQDLHILQETDVVDALEELRDQGIVRAIGLSGKTVAGAEAALAWADVLMVEYHLRDRSHETVLAAAARAGIGVVGKKGLASGHLPAPQAINFVLANPAVTSLVIGGLNLEHITENVRQAQSCSS